MNESGAPVPPGDDAAWAPPSRPAAEPGTLLAGYRDFAVVARGGDSVVYRAHQDALDRDVAVKVVLLDDPESIARFRRELAITVRLGRQHPNIMTVLATGTTTDGQPCLVMDYVELGSLHNRLAERGPLPVSEVVAAGTVVADALAFAHAQGVLHRDVKPQNVLVLPTSYVLADFGLARAIDAGHSSSLERFSYRHAAPQILDGEPPTVADDIYSLGSTLFTLLDGRPPFAADDPDEDSALSYLRRARTEPPRSLQREDLPPALAAAVVRCLSRERSDRFAAAADLRDALSAVPTENRSWSPPAASSPTASPPAPPPTPAAPPTTPAPTTPAPTTPAPPVPPPAAAPVPRPVADPVAAAPEPDPVAVSALAHLATAPPAERDAAATGLRPAPPAPPSLPEPAPEPSRRRWYLIGGVAVAALVAGVVLGLDQGGGGTPAPSTSPPRSPSTTNGGVGLSTAPPVPSFSPTGPVQSGAAVVDPQYRPRITQLDRQPNGTVVIRWTDPTHGRLSFVVFLADSDITAATNRTILASTARAVTGTILTDVPVGRHCVVVSTIAQNEATNQLMFGLGPRSCVSR